MQPFEPQVVETPSRRRLLRRIRELAPWFHNLELDGIQTAPEHFLGDYPRQAFARYAGALPADLAGRSVLDIGCNAGFYSLEMRRRGAGEVVGIDSDPRYLAQARLAAEVLGVSGVEFLRLSVYEVARLRQRFDLVLFMGVLYHLRHPLLALDLIRHHVAGEQVLFQSMQRGSKEVRRVERDYPFVETGVFDRADWPRLSFVEHSYAGDWTNWWIPNRACVEAMLRSSGFRLSARLDDEVYLCGLGDVPPSAAPPLVARW